MRGAVRCRLGAFGGRVFGDLFRLLRHRGSDNLSGEAGVRRAKILWGVAGTIAVLAIALVGVVGSLPAVCSTCHSGPKAALAESSHASVDCYACHLSGGVWGLPQHKANEVLVMYPRRIIGASRAQLSQTSRGACLRCHRSILETVISSGGLRMKHLSCAEGSSCDGCHATVAHGAESGRLSSATMDDCVACHTEVNVSIACDTCHEGDTEPRPRPGAWQVTHGANWQKTHGMGDADSCAVCHGTTFCAKCHSVALPHPESFGDLHGRSAVDSPDACQQCHDRADFCDPCHGMMMPHPVGFVRVHSEEAESMTDARCARCHRMDDCVKCHENHVHPGGATEVGRR